MTNIIFLPEQPAQPRLPAITAQTGTIIARVGGHPRNAEIIVALDANRILIKCTEINKASWITAGDIIAPCRFGGVA